MPTRVLARTILRSADPLAIYGCPTLTTTMRWRVFLFELHEADIASVRASGKTAARQAEAYRELNADLNSLGCRPASGLGLVAK